ncbi:amidohydrolase family protein [uncultured Arsenicicoccus sp.]|uniref:amidohydrolase family protein n=1 Tax=uncultured Arsenicicoccus sp. TaxID=491339 RepID=UPI001E40FB4C|nr:amidohydrolase family protein [Arsenicicoccus cauae]
MGEPAAGRGPGGARVRRAGRGARPDGGDPGSGDPSGARDGPPAGGFEPHETLTIDQAVHGFTVAPARAAGLAAPTGTLRPGAPADLVAWSGDPWRVPATELGALRALTTAVGGVVRRTTA